MRMRKQLCLVATVLLGMIAGSSPAQAGVTLLSQSLSVDRAAGDATFTLDFGHVPDFQTLDASGRPADSFQYEIAADPVAGQPPLANLTSVVRGDEIHIGGNLRIRDAGPPDLSDPQAGGWGSLRGAAPFEILGSKLTFTAPLTLLGAPDGLFAFSAFTLHDGVIQAQAQGSSQAVPLPPAIWAGTALLGAMLLISVARSIRQWNARLAWKRLYIYLPRAQCA